MSMLVLSLDGTQVGPLGSALGGYVVGEVAREQPGPRPFVKKHLSASPSKTGSLVLLSSKRKRELARINMFNLGVYRVAPDRAGAVTARLYCERMEFVR